MGGSYVKEMLWLCFHEENLILLGANSHFP